MVKKKNTKKKIVRVGYCRVSTDDRQEMSLENQIKMMRQQNCNHIYSEHGSRRNDKRMEFQKMLKHIKELAKDENNIVYLIVFNNDRLSRKFRILVNTIEYLMELRVNYISLIGHIETSSIGGKMFFQILSSFNEYEVSNIRERVKISLEKAREKRKILGRPSITKSQKNKLIRLYQLNSLSVNDFAEMCEMKVSAVYKYLLSANIQRRR